MELKFLGSGACFYPRLRNTSAYFVQKKNLVLLDCGETVYEKLMETESLDKFENVYVIITHLHADHVGSLGSLISYFKCILHKRIYVIHPQKTICQLLSLLGIESEFYIYKEEMENQIDGLKIVPHLVNHVPNMECFGYEIQDKETCVYYSGDSTDIPDIVLKKFLEKKVDKIYQDVSTHKSKNPTHMYYEELEKRIPQSERNRVVCMHLDSNCQDLLKEKGFCLVE